MAVPESRPVEFTAGLSVTIQPAGVISRSPPVPHHLPNVDNMPPGNEFDLPGRSRPDTGTFSRWTHMRVVPMATGSKRSAPEGSQDRLAFCHASGIPEEISPKCRGGRECALASQGTSRPGRQTKSFRIPGGATRDLALHSSIDQCTMQRIVL